MTKVGSVIDGKYEILTEIGKGGMSIVYLARDTHLNKQWAVKEIRKKGNSRNDEVIVNSLLAEANLMKKLDHPALPRIVDIIDNGITIYVIMDYIEGESLDKILAEYGPQSEDKVIDWAKQLCDALMYLHKQNPPIIYRDMKPANVMLKPEGNVKIIDFGIAREYKEQRLSDTTVLGTKGYAPPEQYSGQTDARSDIYALGMTMHQLLTGQDPRKGEAYESVRVWKPELSEGIELIIDKCVEPAPEHRYQNCQELLYDLEHPNLITKGYKRKQKQKLNIFLASATLSVLCLLTGTGCKLASVQMNQNSYDVLISTVSATSLEEKRENYKKAISIYPEKTEAYIRLLQAYEDEGKFSKAENDEFLGLYNPNKDKMNPTARDTMELNYKIGTMYFNYYTNDDGSYDFAARVQKAYSFFESNYINGLDEAFAEKNLSDCYYQICSFYKKYILNSSTVEEASKERYESLLAVIYETLERVEGEGSYVRLSLYNSVFMLLYDQRSDMVQVNVDEEQVLKLLDKIYSDTLILTVQKEQSQKLQQEILDHYVQYREAIQRAYANAEDKG